MHIKKNIIGRKLSKQAQAAFEKQQKLKELREWRKNNRNRKIRYLCAVKELTGI